MTTLTDTFIEFKATLKPRAYSGFKYGKYAWTVKRVCIKYTWMCPVAPGQSYSMAIIAGRRKGVITFHFPILGKVMVMCTIKDITLVIKATYTNRYINQNNLITTAFAYISVKIELVYKYLKNTLYVVNGTESVVNYTPVTELDYGTLLCWASNEIGVQEHPCLFQIMAAGKPDPPHNCRAFDVTISSLQVSCLPGDDGGLGQTFILQVLEASGDQEPVVEVTRETASFSVANLRPATAYRLLVTATNAKGESHPAELRAYTVALNHPQHETPAEPTRGRETGSEVAVGVLVGAVLTCLPVAIVVVAMGVRTCLKLRAARWRRRHGDESEKDAGESEGVSTGRPLLTGKGTPGSGGGLSTESGSDITTITGGVGISSSATLPATPSPGHSETQVSQVHPTEAGGMLYTGARIYVPDHTHEAGPQICSTSNAKLRRSGRVQHTGR
nr:uncharacterized protein LOC113804478 [Penaeus vannamei]